MCTTAAGHTETSQRTNAFVNTIYVHEGGELTIEFNFADQHRHVMEYIENNHNDLTLAENVAI